MALALEGQTLLSVEQHRWLLELGPGGAGQEGRALCTGRHDPITCLGSEGCTNPPWGVGQEAGVVVKEGLGFGEDKTVQVLAMLLANKLPDRAFYKTRVMMVHPQVLKSPAC